MKSVIIPYGATSIGDYAFANCVNLNSIVVPDTVNDIGKNAFIGCDNLPGITNLSSSLPI